MSISLLSLLLANLIPLIGVFAFGWDSRTILAVYWLENGIIGVFTLLRIATCRGHRDASPTEASGTSTNGVAPEARTKGVALGARIAMLPFFTVHYGMFWFVHGVFLSTMLGLEDGVFGAGPGVVIRRLIDLATSDSSMIAVASLVLSHGISYVGNFIIAGERDRSSPPTLMFAPYGRVVIMHLTILAGAWIIIWLGEPTALVVLLVALKIAIDAIAHLREHRKLAADRLNPGRPPDIGSLPAG